MLIQRLPEFKNKLEGQTVLLTGSSDGIGFEAAKTFIYMGAKVIIADSDAQKGKNAVENLQARFQNAQAEFYQIDLSDEKQIGAMISHINGKYGGPDIVINLAVNFQTSLLLSQQILPEMKKRNQGTNIIVPPSGSVAVMGACEEFKTKQEELFRTLSAELANTNIYLFAVTPGLVKTEVFSTMHESQIISAEKAGCGLAIAALKAARYNGQEISSVQALIDGGLIDGGNPPARETTLITNELLSVVRAMIRIFKEQYQVWSARSVFERQWVLREFKNTVGSPADQFLNDMENLQTELDQNDLQILFAYKSKFEKMRNYYESQYKLIQGFTQDPEKMKEYTAKIASWLEVLKAIIEKL